jgi:hypothetical protein
MKKLLTKKLGVCLMLAMFTASTAFAQEIYPVMGYIDSITKTKLRVNDMLFRLSPTLKVILKDSSPGKLGDLKKETYIGATTITINRRILIDTIYVLPDRE